MRLGISSWTVPWAIGLRGYPPPAQPMTALGLLDLAEHFGVHLVQIADNMPLHEFSATEIAALRDAAERRGIALQTGTRSVIPEHLLHYLDISRQLGAQVLRTISHTADSKPHITQVKEWLLNALPAFEKAGVAIALENNESHRAAEFAWLVDTVGSPSLGICLDTANSLGALETTEEAVELLAPFAIELHAKDFDIQRIDTRMGFSVVGTAAGEGRVRFSWVLEQFRQFGRNPDIILEHWPPFVETIENTIEIERMWVTRSMGFLRNCVTS